MVYRNKEYKQSASAPFDPKHPVNTGKLRFDFTFPENVTLPAENWGYQLRYHLGGGIRTYTMS